MKGDGQKETRTRQMWWWCINSIGFVYPYIFLYVFVEFHFARLSQNSSNKRTLFFFLSHFFFFFSLSLFFLSIQFSHFTPSVLIHVYSSFLSSLLLFSELFFLFSRVLCDSTPRFFGLSVGWSVGRSVGPLFTFSAFLNFLSIRLLPGCPSDFLQHCSCPHARD